MTYKSVWNLPLPDHLRRLVGGLRYRAAEGKRMVLSAPQTAMLAEAVDLLADAVVQKSRPGKRYARWVARENKRVLKAALKQAKRVRKGQA